MSSTSYLRYKQTCAVIDEIKNLNLCAADHNYFVMQSDEFTVRNNEC